MTQAEAVPEPRPDLRRVQVFDGDGDCVLSVGLARIDADWLTDYLEGIEAGDVYNEPLPRIDPSTSHYAAEARTVTAVPLDRQQFIETEWAASKARVDEELAARGVDLMYAVELADTRTGVISERDGAVEVYSLRASDWNRVVAIARGHMSQKARRSLDTFRRKLERDGTGWLRKNVSGGSAVTAVPTDLPTTEAGRTLIDGMDQSLFELGPWSERIAAIERQAQLSILRELREIIRAAVSAPEDRGALAAIGELLTRLEAEA